LEKHPFFPVARGYDPDEEGSRPGERSRRPEISQKIIESEFLTRRLCRLEQHGLLGARILIVNQIESSLNTSSY
jgi:hypothetical protein